MPGVEIPYERISREALRGVIEEYVTREGTEYGTYEYSLEEKIQAVEAQIKRREVLILFNPQEESVQLAVAADHKPLPGVH